MIGGFVRGVLSGSAVGAAALVVLSVLADAPNEVPPSVAQPTVAPAPPPAEDVAAAPPVVAPAPEEAPALVPAPDAAAKPASETAPTAAANPAPAPQVGTTEPPAALAGQEQPSSAAAPLPTPAPEPGLVAQAETPVQPGAPASESSPPVADAPVSPAPELALLAPPVDAPVAVAPDDQEPAPSAPLEEAVAPTKAPLMTMPEASGPEAAPLLAPEPAPAVAVEPQPEVLPTPEPAPEPAIEPESDPTPEAAPEPAPQPATTPEGAIDPSSDAAPEPAVDPASDPAPTPEPERMPAPEPSADPVAEAAPEPVAPAPPQPEPAAPAVMDDEGEMAPSPGLDFEVEGVTDDRLPQVGDAPAEPAPAAEGTLTEPEADVLDPGDLPPLQREARAFDNPEQKPLFAIILIDTGAADLDRDALAKLPFPVSFALDPMDPASAAHAQLYRAAGQEVLMLATGLPAGAQASDVEVALSVMGDALPQAVAVLDTPTGAFQGDRPLATGVVPVIASQGRGVVTWDRGLNAADQVARRNGVPSAVIFRALDAEAETTPVIRRYLDRAAFKAAQEGQVIVAGTTRPETVAALMEWAVEGRSTSVALAPVTAVLALP